MSEPTRYIFVRHGETEWNRNLRFRGRADVPLNDTGKLQAEKAARYLARRSISAVYASPLSRTMDTARAIAEHHGMTVLAEPALVDLDYGAWQGRTPAEVRRYDPHRYSRWLRQPTRVRIPRGERLQQLEARVMRCIEALATRHVGETVVLVSHEPTSFANPIAAGYRRWRWSSSTRGGCDSSRSGPSRTASARTTGRAGGC